MTDIILLRRAAFDIDDILQDSTERWGAKVANEYMDSIDDALQRLAEFPHLLRPFADSEALYFYPVRKHSLFCTVCNDTIYVLTMVYGGMDLERVIRTLEPTLLNEVVIMQETLQTQQDATKKPR